MVRQLFAFLCCIALAVGLGITAFTQCSGDPVFQGIAQGNSGEEASSAAESTALPESSLRDQPAADGDAVMLGVVPYCQHPAYPTGCESAALYMLLRYYGTSATMEEIVESLPKGSVPCERGGGLYGGNPETVFVGDPRDPHSYGVFEKPIAAAAQRFRSGAVSEAGAAVDRVLALVQAGIPVIAWYTTHEDGTVERGTSWIDEASGDVVTWLRGEHAVVVNGCCGGELYYCDPNTGTQRSVPTDTFAKAFSDLGGRIVYYPA